VLEKSIQTDLYRVDLFRRTDRTSAQQAPSVAIEPLDSVLEPEVERHVVWGGAILRRADAARSETIRLPVLAYHRIAEDGPAALAPYRVSPRAFEEQMRFLRRHGYHTISSADLVGYRRAGIAMQGRPVLITFDDGYRDFYQNAWPILRRCDFTAEVFLPTDRIGGRADWDSAHGKPAPLMSWDEMRAAQAEGVRFGSHLASHTAATALSAEALLREGIRSRSMLERGLGCEVRTVAVPYGACDERARRILLCCGYTQIFTGETGLALTDRWSTTAPRNTVLGDDTIDDFAKYLQ
jgi:peptidoglycan/xylan/chitin deacetylase (PgdA/CDA1 family)